MLESKHLYLILLLISIAYPLAQSFEKRIRFYKNWKALFLSILIMALIFIPWDVWFTAKGVWWFNDDYTSGFRILGLPIEEWSFFVAVPYACIFLYEVLNYFIKKDILRTISTYIYIVVAMILTLALVFHYDKIYTLITFGLTITALILLIVYKPQWRGRFLLMYLISWLPFMLLNGVLTGNFTMNAVVNYNIEEFMGIRITTIPFEDSVYSFLMLLIVVAVYEWRKEKLINN